jgi:hypothetical protein
MISSVSEVSSLVEDEFISDYPKTPKPNKKVIAFDDLTSKNASDNQMGPL